MISRWVVGVALLFGILLFMLPKTDEESVTKLGSASMLVCTKELREQVERQVLANAPVTAEFSNKCPDLIATLELDEGGGMVITGNKHPVTLTLRPVVEAGKVRWSCRGEPEGTVTKLCKP